jgi:hypothetical protein
VCVKNSVRPVLNKKRTRAGWGSNVWAIQRYQKTCLEISWDYPFNETSLSGSCPGFEALTKIRFGASLFFWSPYRWKSGNYKYVFTSKKEVPVGGFSGSKTSVWGEPLQGQTQWEDSGIYMMLIKSRKHKACANFSGNKYRSAFHILQVICGWKSEQISCFKFCLCRFVKVIQLLTANYLDK